MFLAYALGHSPSFLFSLSITLCSGAAWKMCCNFSKSEDRPENSTEKGLAN